MRLRVLVTLAALVAGTAASQAQPRVQALPLRVAAVERPAAARPAPSTPSAPSSAVRWWLRGTTRLTTPNGASTVRYGVDAIGVWKRSRGEGVVVADVDTGVDPSQPELRGALVAGRGFGRNAWPDLDANGHGTGVASLILGRGVKVAGVAPRARLLELAALDMFGDGAPADVAAALRYAAQRKDVRVVNLSLGTRRPSPSVRAAVRANLRAGKLVVAAAGNESEDATGMIPCSYRGVVCVGASAPTGELARFSNHGPTVVLNAPGDDLLAADTTLLHEGRAGTAYEPCAGTSAAAALVTGVAALLFSAHPRAGADDVLEALLDGLRPIDALRGRIWFPGVVNAAASLTALDAICAEGRCTRSARAVPAPASPAAPARASAR